MKGGLFRKAEELLSRESGTVFKEPGGRVSVCLVYPNTYHVGMSSLGFQGVYTLLNERDDVLCERAFLPDPEDMEEYVRTGTPVFSIESRRPLGSFDIVAFSVSFENDYPNIARILQLSKIPLAARDRNEKVPLLMMGGVCAFSNPEPLAALFDVVFVGEAEEMLDDFMDAFAASPTREEVFRRAMGMGGVYLPAFYEVRYDQRGFVSARVPVGGAPETIKRRYVADLSRRPLRPSIITPETEFPGMYLIEAQRGCPWHCGFCLAGQVFNPPRKKGLEAVRAEVEAARAHGGRVGLIGPSLSDYPYRKEVLQMPGVDFSITSLRASPESAELVSLLRGHRSVSIAPEAGTDRLRKVINKRITEDDILETARRVFEHGVERLKLYFMVGLPTETPADIEGIVSLVTKIRDSSPGGKLILTLSTFVPKPFTPFQWHPMEEMKIVKERLKTIKKGLSPLRGVGVFHDVPKYAYMQGMFAMGDRRVGGSLGAMAAEEDWRRAAASAGVEPDFYMMRQKEFEEPLPWDFIDARVRKERLWEEYRRLVEAR